MTWLQDLRLDLEEGARNVRLLRRLSALRPDGAYTDADAFEANVRRAVDRAAVRFEERVLSFRELDAAANRRARWALAQGLGHGDVVALLMENRPEFLAAWLGHGRVGRHRRRPPVGDASSASLLGRVPAGRSRQWLGAVPAAGVWPARQSSPQVSKMRRAYHGCLEASATNDPRALPLLWTGEP